MGDRGLEQTVVALSKTRILPDGGAKSGALFEDSDLNWLTEHWSVIPEPTRKLIIETAKAALKQRGGKACPFGRHEKSSNL